MMRQVTWSLLWMLMGSLVVVNQAIDLIDEAGSRVRLRHAQLPEEARDLDKELRALLKEKDAAVRGQVCCLTRLLHCVADQHGAGIFMGVTAAASCVPVNRWSIVFWIVAWFCVIVGEWKCAVAMQLFA